MDEILKLKAGKRNGRMYLNQPMTCILKWAYEMHHQMHSQWIFQSTFGTTLPPQNRGKALGKERNQVQKNRH